MDDLFRPIIATQQLHPQFSALLHSPVHVSVRRRLNELFSRMGDADGNFIPDFQGAGYHARVFELCCFAYLESAGFIVDHSYARPDFIAARQGTSIAIEVVTTNPTDGANRDVSVARLEEWTPEETLQKVVQEFPKRMLRAMARKLKHEYHKLPHVAGNPLVLMLAPFFEPGACFFIDDSLLPAIFATSDATIDAPLFSRPGSESISAVAYCNAFSISKLWRLSDPVAFRTTLYAEREGHGYFSDPDTLYNFKHLVGASESPAETWHEGVTLLINPNAKVSLQDGLLPASSTILVSEGAFTRRVVGFHPLASTMLTWPRQH